MTFLKRSALLLAVLSISALAKGSGTPQTHECVKGGAVVQKTKKECKAEGGEWKPKASAAKDGGN